MLLPTKAEYLQGLVPSALPFQLPNGEAGEDIECPICRVPYDPSVQIVETNCKHKFCYDCLLSWNQEHSDCPTCRRKLYIPENSLDDLFEDDFDQIIENRAAPEAAVDPDLGAGFYVPGEGTYFEVNGEPLLLPEVRAVADPNSDRIVLDAHTVYHYVRDYIRSASEPNAPSLPVFWGDVQMRNARYTFSRVIGTSEFRYAHMSASTWTWGEGNLDFPGHELHLQAYRVSNFLNTPGNEDMITSVVNRARLNTMFHELWAEEHDVRIDSEALARLALPDTDDGDLTEAEDLVDGGS